jgi:hypothetical protein
MALTDFETRPSRHRGGAAGHDDTARHRRSPIAAARFLLWERRHRIVATSFLGGLAAALMPILTYPGQPERPPPDWIPLLEAAAARGPLATLTGSELAAAVYQQPGGLVPHFYNWPAALATVVTLLLAVVAVWFGDASRRLLALGCLGFGGLIVIASLDANWSPFLETGIPGVMAVQRYCAGPAPFLFSVVVLRVGRDASAPVAGYYAGRADGRRRCACLRRGVSVAVPTSVDCGHNLDDAVEQAASACAAGHHAARVTATPPHLFVTVPFSILTR